MSNRFLATLMLACLCAGCAQPTPPGALQPVDDPASPAQEPPEPDEERQREPPATPPSASSSTSSRAATPAGPPDIQLFAASRADPASLTVTFTFSSTDPSGRDLAWGLDADGDGEMDAQGLDGSGSVAHTYTSSKVYAATLTVAAQGEKASRELEVNATVPPFVIEDSYLGWDAWEAALPGGCPMGGPNYKGQETTPPIGGHWYDGITAPIGGWTYRFEPAGHGFHAWFNEMDGAVYTGGGTETGVVPPNTHYIYICATEPGAGGEYRFIAEYP